MSVTVGPRERAIFTQTLAPFLRGVIGKRCRIELKNDLMVEGRVTDVDCFMNVSMQNACMSSPSGQKSRFEFFFLQRRSIRFVQIPDELPIQAVLQRQVDIAIGAKQRQEQKKLKERRAAMLRKREQKRMANPNM